MSEVLFYVFASGGAEKRMQFACQLAEKAYRENFRVHIATSDQPTTRRMDDLLWTFRDGSFVPHEVLEPGAPGPESPVTIGGVLPVGGERTLLINLGEEIPAQWQDVQKLAEIVVQDDDSRDECRRRYARYRELGHTPESHNLS